MQKYSEVVFEDFVRMLLFDVLVGEQDRHKENWGILIQPDNSYSLSPLYDTASCLMRECKNDEMLEKFGERKDQINFRAYNERCKVKIQDDNYKALRGFDLVRALYNILPNVVEEQIRLFTGLPKNRIEGVVSKIPTSRMTNKHKQYIMKYIELRRQILMEILDENR